MKKISISITPSLLNEVQAMADKRELTLSDAMRRVIEKGLGR
jgi:metal-responsive CopG/Arc/MetJ family transcriptional regulator